MGEVIQFPKRPKKPYITSLGCFQTEDDVDYRRVLSEYRVVSGPGQKIVVHVPIQHDPADENDSHAIMSVVTHLLHVHAGRLFLPVGPVREDAAHLYIIKEC